MSEAASANAAAQVFVVGSANHDILLTVPALPGAGETVIADETLEFLGGKGQSQAIAAGLFGSPTTLLASVGDDDWGRRVRTALVDAGIDTGRVRTVPGATGRAIVTVDRDGENSIVVERGANAGLQSLLPEDRVALGQAALLLVQYEVGDAVAFESIRAAGDADVRVVLNAAPAMATPLDVLEHVDYLIANEIEACQLAGEPDIDRAAEKLLETVGAVLVTLGAEGGVFHRAGTPPIVQPAMRAEVVDTTGAGDSVCGVFTSAIAQGYDELDAFRLGLLAGSLATEVMGCVPSIPDRRRVFEAFAAAHGRAPKRH